MRGEIGEKKSGFFLIIRVWINNFQVHSMGWGMRFNSLWFWVCGWLCVWKFIWINYLVWIGGHLLLCWYLFVCWVLSLVHLLNFHQIQYQFHLILGWPHEIKINNCVIEKPSVMYSMKLQFMNEIDHNEGKESHNRKIAQNRKNKGFEMPHFICTNIKISYWWIQN